MHNIGTPGVAGGELVIMVALRIPLLPIRVTTDRDRIRVFTDQPTTDLRPGVAAELRHQPMLSAMAHSATVAVRPLVATHVVQAVRPVRVPLVHVREFHRQAR